jgi:hypothetical protein
VAVHPPSVSSPEAPPRLPVPKQTKDPVWSLKPWPVVVTVGGRDYEFPAATAADWLSVLMVEQIDLDDVVRYMAQDGEDLLYREDVGAELYDTILEVIDQVSGRPWWQAMRLISVATANWNVVGAEMLYRGVLPDQMSLSGWLDVLLIVILRLMDPKDVTMFTLQLENPPVQVIEGTQVEEEMSMSREQFLSM